MHVTPTQTDAIVHQSYQHLNHPHSTHHGTFNFANVLFPVLCTEV